MKLILIKNNNEFPCIAKFPNGKLRYATSPFRSIGVTYHHYYLTSFATKKVGNWVLNIDSKYDHKEVCRIDNEIELERYANQSNRIVKIEFTSDPKLGLNQYTEINSFLNENNSILNKLKQLSDEELKDGWAKTEKYDHVKPPYVEKSGFFDLPEISVCGHPEHEPPTHLYIPTGKGYRHICPECGKTVVLKSNQITF